MKGKINIGIIGASGYSGEELIRLLAGHPFCNIKLITSRKYAGLNIGEIFPRFAGLQFKFVKPDIEELLNEDIDVFFLALPHKVASEFAVPLYEAGRKIIDISADFRIKDSEIYRKYYGISHNAPELLEESVYGLPEIYRDKISKGKLIACPGCYPTCILLPIYPLLKQGLVSTRNIIICSGSGITGAGRKIDLPYIFPECNESFRAYSPVGHRHIPEIEQEINRMTKDNDIVINFIPHLVPMNRGMNSTIILDIKDSLTKKKLEECYLKFYGQEKFIRLLPYGKTADTKNVTKTNICELGYTLDERTNKLIVTSCIDNLTKGASGQAVQCMNIMFDLDETTGLM